MFTVSGNFDSANPRPEGIEKVAENHYILRPFSETDIESFKLDTQITNSSTECKTIKLDVFWKTEPFSELRDCFYWKHESSGEWIVIPASTAPGKSFIEFAVSPGCGILSLHPHYGYEDCEKFVASLDHPALESKIAGKTDKGRNIRLLKAAAVINKPEKKFLISARNHANESSGSYCVEGMLHWLLSDDPLALYALSRHEFYFIPMSNPDGVADGMARHTGNKLTDLNKTEQWHRENCPAALSDSTLKVYTGLLDSIQPTHFMNLHSYLFKFQDELYVRAVEEAERFFRFMPDQIKYGKVWKTRIHDHKPFPTGYCHEKYDTFPLLPEIPWFGRNAAAMRETGADLLKAFILMNTVGAANWGDI